MALTQAPAYISKHKCARYIQPAAGEALRAALTYGQPAAVEPLVEPCTVFQTDKVVVLEAQCLFFHVQDRLERGRSGSARKAVEYLGLAGHE